MHRLPSSTSLRNFRLATLLIFMLGAGLLGFLGLGAAAVLLGDHQLVRVFLWVAGSLPVIALVYLVIGLRARCPLCMNPPLAPRRCQKHRRARTILGSHRLRVALAIFFRGRFTCPYCGEVTSMEVRQSRRRR